MDTDKDFISTIFPVSNSSTMQNYIQLYEYDALGNILSMSSQYRWNHDYIYDTLTNRLKNHDENQISDDYTYDSHGNMLTMPHLSAMAWDYNDRLIRVNRGGDTIYYRYDISGNRTRKVIEKQGGIIEERLYLGGVEDYRKTTSGTLNLHRQTLHMEDEKKTIALVESLIVQSGPTISPLIRYQYVNHLGSACLELSGFAAIISYEEYHPFGTTSYRSGGSESEVSMKRYKYVGKELDSETGLYYYGARYYAAWIARFVSVDPLQFKYPHFTPFQYAGNRPVTMIDIDGNEPGNPDIQKIPVAKADATNVQNTGSQQAANSQNAGTSQQTILNVNNVERHGINQYQIDQINKGIKEFNLKRIKGEDQNNSSVSSDSLVSITGGKNVLATGVHEVSQQGIDFIASWEKYKQLPYHGKADASGVMTVGYGHVILAGENFSKGLTPSEAMQLLRKDIKIAENAINKVVTIPLKQDQFNALTSYIFNTGSLVGTKLLENLNSSNFTGAVREMNIVKANGVVTRGLVNRREDERNIFNYGIYKMHK